jgi:hypothetical protein
MQRAQRAREHWLSGQLDQLDQRNQFNQEDGL